MTAEGPTEAGVEARPLSSVNIESDLVVTRYLGARIEDGLSILVDTEEGVVEIVFPLDDLARRVYGVLTGASESERLRERISALETLGREFVTWAEQPMIPALVSARKETGNPDLKLGELMSFHIGRFTAAWRALLKEEGLTQ